jgi:hypothetical protein
MGCLEWYTYKDWIHYEREVANQQNYQIMMRKWHIFKLFAQYSAISRVSFFTEWMYFVGSIMYYPNPILIGVKMFEMIK